jgi:DNA (cytosine-5)-methyltransferase 1
MCEPELTGRVGSHFKRKRISLDNPLNTVNSSGAAQQRFELSELSENFPPGSRVIHDTSGNRSAGDATDRLSPTITNGIGGLNSYHFQVESGKETGNSASLAHPTEKRKFTISELKRICAFPDDFTLIGTYAQQWERLGNSVPPLMMRAVAEVIRDKVLLF